MNRSDSGSNLRIFLRNSDTGHFYKKPGQWVQNPREATTFETRHHALEERERIPKPQLELLILDERERVRFGLRLWKDDQ